MQSRLAARYLLGTSLAAASWCAQAQTTVSSERTSPLVTSTAGSITVTEDGSVELNSGVPVTIDSADSLTVEEGGLIYAGDNDGVSAILVTTGSSFNINNDGSVRVEEGFVQEDDDGNSVADGPIAEVSNRAAIRITQDSRGSIVNSGSIRVEGLNSYGIVSAGVYTGDIFNEGSIDVIGDYSKAIDVAHVVGDVELEGSVSAVGEGAQAVVVGDVDGSLRIGGQVSKGMSYTNDDGSTVNLSRGDLRVRAPAVEVNGNVTGGIRIDARPYDLDQDVDDEDNDGVDDDEEATGTIRSYGVSPALYIGGASAIDVGTVEGREGSFSLAIDGSISADAGYSSISTVAIEIGGNATTSLAGGIGVTGSVSATTYDSSSTAILLNETAIVPSLYNSGTIAANITSSGDGSTVAIVDHSGTLMNVVNTGTINAAGSNEDVKIALDLRQASSGVTLSQYLNSIDQETKTDEEDDDGYNPDDPTIYTAVYGDILLGEFDDAIILDSGLIKGNVEFAGGSDSFRISDDAVFDGDVYGGSGNLTVSLFDRSKFYGLIDAGNNAATLTLNDQALFSGHFANAGALTVNVDGGTLRAANGEVASFGTLNVGAAGAIAVVIDGEEGTSSSFDVGTATFASGSKLKTAITSIANAEGTYTVLTADTLNGAPTYDPEQNDIPLLFNADLEVTSNQLLLTIARKSAQELGFNAAQSSAYDPVIEFLDDQATLEQSILQAESLADLNRQFGELLPDYAGGVFDFTVRATQAATARIQTQDPDFSEDGDSAFWLSPIYFRSTMDNEGAEKLKLRGKGGAGGFELFTDIGTVGIDASYVSGKVENGSRQTLDVGQFEGGLYWRNKLGPVYAFGRLGAGSVSVSSERLFNGTVDGGDLTYTNSADWSGIKLSALTGLSIPVPVTSTVTLRPKTVLDYQWLREKGYSESSDGGIGLDVDKRRSSRLSALTSLNTSFRLGQKRNDSETLALDFEVGRRFYVAQNAGATSAAFEDGEVFSIAGLDRKSRWEGQARLHGGGYMWLWDVALTAEKSTEEFSAGARLSLTTAF